jgi:hypothetical protein
MERLREPLVGEIQFPEVNIPISDEDLYAVRKYILESSGAYDSDAIAQQLLIDFDPSPLNRYVRVEFSDKKTIDPYAIAIALEQNSFKFKLELPFFNLINVAYDVRDDLDRIAADRGEGAIKFTSDSNELFDNAPILKSLLDELEVLKTNANNREYQKNAAKFLENEKYIESFTRAILIQKAILIAINYR